MPYYLLIVGSPEAIPYLFQYQLDVQYAVGRIHFDHDADYRNYARSVVEAEKQQIRRSRAVSLFGPENPGDFAAALSSSALVQPLAESIHKDKPDWAVETKVKDDAGKAEFETFFRAENGPALFFSASHGMAFDNGDACQRAQQGALVCQDWPGPSGPGGAVPPEWYFSGDDIDEAARPAGLIAFFFACFGGGTPLKDDFAQRAFRGVESIAPEPFIARLPERMLAHPNGGALAVAGHVERAWGFSFNWPGAGAQLGVFESAVKRLMEGRPIGSAMEFFNERYAELSSELSDELQGIRRGKTPNDLELAEKWIATTMRAATS